jgi:DUF971 family protein
MPDKTPQPTEIRLSKTKDELSVRFDNGDSFTLGAELLRVNSPSAEVQGHGPSGRQRPGGKRDVLITRIEPVGNYAIRLHFSDGHNTGLYSWRYLHHLGASYDQIWAEYLHELAEKGLSRT